MTITTIITTHQRPALLKRAIDSVLKQTYSDFQVCIYDNASSDETEEIVRSLMKQDSRIKYHCHPQNIGMMANYQFAFSQIGTDFFSVLSDDDFLLPEFYEMALKGFEQFPDAAFSACGVKAIDENEQFVSAPLSVWKREGYFALLEGLSEMIEKPLLPNGILFQHKYTKEIRIDPSKEVQIRWDTDYLLQLVSRFPFVVNRRIGAMFLSHSQGYSTAHYRQMPGSVGKFFEHLDATDKIKQRLITSLGLFSDSKNDAHRSFYKEFKRHLSLQVGNCIDVKLFSNARLIVSMCRVRYGFKSFFAFLLLKIWIFENANWIVPFARKLSSMKRSVRSWFMPK